MVREGTIKRLANLVPITAWDKYAKINYVPLPAHKEPKKYYNISICTTCMDRLEDLKQTYIKNIEDNKDYPNIEFVLLNYNSHDDLDTWVYRELDPYDKTGIFCYYHVDWPKYYSMAHSRNVAFKLATGDIVCSVDGDHFINKGFAAKINELANTLGPKTIFVKSEQKNRGRIAMFKKDFLDIGGYDEEIKDYGFEDRDLLYRASALGFKVVKYGGEYFNLTSDHRRHPVSNYVNKEWKYTQERNALVSLYNLYRKKYIANQNKPWGVYEEPNGS